MKIKEKVTVAAIKPNMIAMIWPIVSPMIDMAIAHSNGELCLDDMKKQLLDGEMLLLVVYESDLVVCTLTIEKRRFSTGLNVLNVTTAGGADLHIWMDTMMEVLEDLSRQHDCTEIYVVGRPGWQRALKRLGFETIHTTVCKKVGVK